tara:strand:- start:100752 stop:100940 length:189 start_codon:yes stop_codon:yes gene_type:complete
MFLFVIDNVKSGDELNAANGENLIKYFERMRRIIITGIYVSVYICNGSALKTFGYRVVHPRI